jgi:TPR repeat protein
LEPLSDMTFKNITSLLLLALALNACAAPKSADDAVQRWYPNQDYLQALETEALEAEAGSGSAEAKLHLAIRFVNGDRITLDYDKGLEIFKRLSEDGDARAQYMLGTAYFQGAGVELSSEKGIEWYKKSAEGEYDVGQYWYAFMLSRGRGVPEIDWETALPWYRKAADQGHATAQFALGEIYESCKAGLDRDFDKAAYWYRRANGPQKNLPGQYNLRRLIDLGLADWENGDPGVPPKFLVSMDDASFPACAPGAKDPLLE